MGKGDKKTKRGKISMGSYGVTRPKAKNNKKGAVPDRKPVKKAETKKEEVESAESTSKTSKSKAPAKKTTDKKTTTSKKEEKK